MQDKYLDLLENLLINQNPDDKDEFLTELYIIVHLARWVCNNPHKDWVDKIQNKYFKTYKSIDESNWVDKWCEVTYRLLNWVMYIDDIIFTD